MTETKPRAAAIYTRISRDAEKSGLGVQRQEEDCRTLARSLGWQVVDVYCDNDISATRGKLRPAYRRMLRDIEAGTVDAIVSWHTDRLHRSPLELEGFITLCESHNVDIRTVRAGHLDLSSATGRMVARQLGVAARYESEIKAERIARAHAQRARAGAFNGGRRCFGWEPDGVTPRESEAIELRNAAEQILTGVSLRSIVADLNARGVRTASGNSTWSSRIVKAMLVAPRQAGLRAYRGEIVADAVWPAIIDRDTWEAVRSILTDPARRTNHVGGIARWLGSGLYVCGVCGSTDVRMSIVEGRRRYRCRNRVKGDPQQHVGRDQRLLDEYVAESVCARLSQADAQQALAPSNEIDTAPLHVEAAALTARLDALATMFASGTITATQLQAGTVEIERRRGEVMAVITAAASRSPLAAVLGVDDVREAWDGLSVGVQREILRATVTVRLLPTRPGRKSEGSYFDFGAVDFDWHL